LRTIALASLALVACLVSAELLCRLLPVSTSTHLDYYTDADVPTYPAHWVWRVSTGWDLLNPQTLHANNAGFASSHDFVRNPDAVALIGDSYVEASMLDTEDRPEAQLERALGGRRPVYALGRPGTALLDYAERIRLAHDRWGIKDFVILMEAGDVRQALCGSGNVESRCLDPSTLEPRIERLTPPSKIKKLLRESAFAEYLVAQLRLDPVALVHGLLARVQGGFGVNRPAAGVQRNAPESPDRPEVTEAVTRAFFQRVRPYISGRLIIIVDGQRTPGPLVETAMTVERARFIALARAAGATVVDAVPLYRAHFERSPLLLSVGPYDGHFNRLGVQIVCNAAAAALRARP
jgi:hypothetical protein